MTISWLVFEVIVNILQGALFAYVGVSIFDSKPRFKSNLYYFLSTWLSCGAMLTIFLFFPLSFVFLDIIIIAFLFIFLRSYSEKEPSFQRYSGRLRISECLPA